MLYREALFGERSRLRFMEDGLEALHREDFRLQREQNAR